MARWPQRLDRIAHHLAHPALHTSYREPEGHTYDSRHHYWGRIWRYRRRQGSDDACEVALVEQKDTFVNHAAALRATVDREWAERLFLPYAALLKRGRVVHGTAL